jgi:hypothetical protein
MKNTTNLDAKSREISHDHSPLREALDRRARFKKELQEVDPIIRTHLLGAWKEQVIGDCIRLLKATDDPQDISNVDLAIALSIQVNGLRINDH